MEKNQTGKSPTDKNQAGKSESPAPVSLVRRKWQGAKRWVSGTWLELSMIASRIQQGVKRRLLGALAWLKRALFVLRIWWSNWKRPLAVLAMAAFVVSVVSLFWFVSEIEWGDPNTARTAIDSAHTAIDSAYTAIDTAHNDIVSAHTAIDTARTAIVSARTAIDPDSARINIDAAQSAIDTAHTAIDTARTAIDPDTARINIDNIDAAQSAIDSARIAIISYSVCTPIDAAQSAIDTAYTPIDAAYTPIDSARIAIISHSACTPIDYDSVLIAIASARTAIISARTTIASARTAIASARTAIISARTIIDSAHLAIESLHLAIQSFLLVLTPPIAFVLWVFRDRNAQATIKNQRKDVNLKQFLEVQLHAGGAFDEKLSAEAREPLQIAALHQLPSFINGHFGDDFRRPAFELLIAGHEEAIDRIGLTKALDERCATMSEPSTMRDILNQKYREQLTVVDRTRIDIIGSELKIVLYDDKFPLFPLQNRNFDMIEIDLPRHIDFNKFSLDKSSLRGAKMMGVHLEKARLSSARLEGAIMIEAHLNGADLSSAHLEGAKMMEAHLEGANLIGAHLEGANLEGAIIDDNTKLAPNWPNLTPEERKEAQQPLIDRGAIYVPRKDDEDNDAAGS